MRLPIAVVLGLWTMVHAEDEQYADVSDTPVPQDTNSTLDAPRKIKFYADPRPDRTGRQLFRFVDLDAYAYKEGGVAAGICPYPDERIQEKHRYHDEHINEATTMRALEYMGLDKMFAYACPDPEELKTGEAVLLPDTEFYTKGLYYTPEWHADFLARIDSHLIREPQRPNDRKKVAVHIRRGDITPCAHSHRYLPNSFYHEAIEKYLPPHCGESILDNCKVTIYTEHGGLESLQTFIDLGYNVNVGSSLGKVLYDFVTADVLFAGSSSFSYVPGLMNSGHVIINARSEFKAVENFETIGLESDLMKRAEMEKDQLWHTHCGTNRRNMLMDVLGTHFPSWFGSNSDSESEGIDGQVNVYQSFLRGGNDDY